MMQLNIFEKTISYRNQADNLKKKKHHSIIFKIVKYVLLNPNDIKGK